MMWKVFFTVCDALCSLIPNREKRNHTRVVRLYDWRRKYMALKHAFPELNFRRTKMIKGGWNIGFIVDNKYVFKIRKFCDNSVPMEKIERQSRITNAFADIVPLRIPRMEIVNIDGYTFYKYDFIRGKNLNKYSTKTITKHREQWGRQLAEFIYAMHNANPIGLADLKTTDGDGWNHHDICNNVIVDPKTMKIVGLIDWEYAGWGPLETELVNVSRFSSHMRKSGINDVVRREYQRLIGKNRQKTKSLR